MKYFLSLYIITLLSLNSMAQSNDQITLKLQQIEISDHHLRDVISEMAKDAPECFTEDNFYTLNFFQPTLADTGLVLALDKFDGDENITKLLTYYTVINGLTYFLSDKVPGNSIQILPSTKIFNFNPTTLRHTDKYNFAAWRLHTIMFQVLSNSCEK